MARQEAFQTNGTRQLKSTRHLNDNTIQRILGQEPRVRKGHWISGAGTISGAIGKKRSDQMKITR